MINVLLLPNKARIVEIEQSCVRLKEENNSMEVQMNHLMDQQQRDGQQIAAQKKQIRQTESEIATLQVCDFVVLTPK